MVNKFYKRTWSILPQGWILNLPFPIGSGVRSTPHLIRVTTLVCYKLNDRSRNFLHQELEQLILPSVLWHCWFGDRKGICPVSKLGVGCWWWRFDWSFARLIAAVVTTTSVILTSNKIQNEDILVPLTQVHLENGRWNGERVGAAYVLYLALNGAYCPFIGHVLCIFCPVVFDVHLMFFYVSASVFGSWRTTWTTSKSRQSGWSDWFQS